LELGRVGVCAGPTFTEKMDRRNTTLVPATLRKTGIYNTLGSMGQTHKRGIREGQFSGRDIMGVHLPLPQRLKPDMSWVRVWHA